MKVRRELLRGIISLTALSLAMIGGGSVSVYAEIIYGDGTDSSNADFHACDQAERWQNVRECSSKHGGASWHVFSVDNLPIHDENRPNSDSKPILTASLWNGFASNDTKRQKRFDDMREELRQCSSGYYVAFVYDGWYGKGTNWSRKSLIYYGPLAWKEYEQSDGNSYHTPIYHKGGTDHTANQVITGLSNGTNMNGWRIDGEGPTNAYVRASRANWRSDEATKLYRIYKNDNSANIPKGTGWFCLAGESYEGKVETSGGATSTMNYRQSSTTKNLEVSNCTNGCSVTFSHSLHRKDGISGETPYSITRESSNTNVVSNGTLHSGNSGGHTWTDTVNLRPGMRVCETLSFRPQPKKNEEANIKVCVRATGDAGSSSLDMKVRNHSVNKYNEYLHEVYAKPRDLLSHKGSYQSTVQSSYNDNNIPEKVKSGGTLCPSGTTVNTTKILRDQFNACTPSWKNAFSMVISGNNINSTRNFTYDNGDAGSKQEYSTSYLSNEQRTVAQSDVGSYIKGKAHTNLNGDTKNTPNSLSYSLSSDLVVANFDIDRKDTSEAKAYVPYNFTTAAEITTPETKEDGSPTVIYAGEETSVAFRVDINNKINRETTNNPESEKYATRADSVKRELVVYNPDVVAKKNGGTMSGNRSADVCSGYFGHSNDEVSCGYSKVTTANMTAGEHTGLTEKFYAQDLKAGSQICIAVAVFPATSGADTNWNDLEYSRSWRISNSKCYKVAKKPSVQVWGGNIYTKGGITTAVSRKNNLSGYTTYSVSTAHDKNYIFGSFGELGLISSGVVTGFASGAATGYGSDDANGNLWPVQTYVGATGVPGDYTGRGNNGAALYGAANPGPGGVLESKNSTSFCNRSVLTFANATCGGGVAGSIGISTGANQAKNDRDAVIARLIPTDASTNVSGVVNISDGNSYYYSHNDIEMSAATISTNNVIKVVHSTDDIIINGNLEYSAGADGGYISLFDIPKLVIYAEKNVYIGCNVSRIDALIMADEEVRTCADKNGNIPELNDKQRSNQLKVNGAIISKTLAASRTYGAATGANSIIAAEILDFDPTLYLWAGEGSGSDGSTGGLNYVYMRELSPRR